MPDAVVARYCTCPPDRNGIDCPVHVITNAPLMRHLERAPLYHIVAWELDLNWVGDPHELFWQHRPRYSMWPFPAYVGSIRCRYDHQIPTWKEA